MNKSDSIAKLSAALAKAFPKIGAAHKGSSNPFFGSAYSNLESVMDAVKEPLAEHGLSVLQLVGMDGGDNVLETVILHESGEFISSSMKIVCAKQDPQGFGSGISYAKRYALQAALFVPSTDDDGEGAMNRQPKEQKPVTVKSTPKNAPSEPAADAEPTFKGPSHKKLFETLMSLGATDEEFMSAMKYEKLIPEKANSFWAMSDTTAEKFLRGDTAVDAIKDAIVTWRAIAKP